MTDDWLKNSNERVEEWLTNNMITADDDGGEEDSVVIDHTNDDDGDDHEEEDSVVIDLTNDDDDGDDHEEDMVVVDLTSDDDGGEDTGTKQPAVYEPSVDGLVKQIDNFLENQKPDPQLVCTISSITCGHCGYVFT